MSTTTVTPPTRTAGPLPSGLTIARRRAVLEIRLFLREPQQVVFSFAYPAVMLLIFGSVFHGQDITDHGVPYAQYFLAGIAATGIMLTSFQAIGIALAVERDDGSLAQLQATTMPTWAYVLGKAAQVLVLSVVQLLVLLVLARIVFAVPLPVDAAHWLTFAWVALLGSVAGSVTGAAVGSLIRSGKTANVVIAPIAIVLEFFSGVFFDYAQLPGWMRQVAALFPLKWMTQGMRSAVLPEGAARMEVAGSWEHGRTALVLGVWVIMGVVVGARTFRWRPR